MGNEKSQPAGLVIKENAIEVTDRWSLHSASYSGVGGNPKISVFVGPVSVLPSNHNLLEKFAKNLMVHRHPSVLKYVTTWQKGEKFYLATESVKPLVQVLPTQTALQVCIGLQNILKALIFLHDKALSVHNNVCRAAIYVTQDGCWKLGGLEYLSKFSELKSGYLSSNEAGRYDAGISPSDQGRMPQPPSSIDCFAFGVMAEEVLSAYSPDDVPGMQEFLEICKHKLKNSQAASRPPLNTLLNITFFTHEFINIHNFLTELTLKTDNEKQDFFRDLSHKLSMFDEEVVASQLSALLLSRMVLLDTTAQQHLLPLLFAPRSDPDDDVCSGRLFGEKTFKTHLVPKLLPMFCVRDAHVRLILLTHFASFCSTFSSTHLKTHILPELLVGIKDTNDSLVSCTLRALADIVPILGSSVVIGGKSRRKLFADGRPKAATGGGKMCSKNQSALNAVTTSKHSESDLGDTELYLPERASPDGGEDLNSPLHTPSEEETENWTDWENNVEDASHSLNCSEDKAIDEKGSQSEECVLKDHVKTEQDLSCANVTSSNSNRRIDGLAKSDKVGPPLPHAIHKTTLPDITSLDVKMSKSNDGSGKSLNGKMRSLSSNNETGLAFKEIDYFQDMEPIIVASNKHIINDVLSSTAMGSKNVNKFQMDDEDLLMNQVEGWGDDIDDLDVDVLVRSDL